MERHIDEIARTKRWVRIDEATLNDMVKRGHRPSSAERADLLRKALEADDVDVVAGLIDLGADPNGAYGANRTTPLTMVQSAAAARELLDAGANPNKRNRDGLTPLGWAAHLAPDVTELLLNSGARVNDRTDRESEAPLWIAACSGNAGVVKLLLDRGVDPTVRREGRSIWDCVQWGRDLARVHPRKIREPSLRFIEDFDAVIALLEQSLPQGKRN